MRISSFLPTAALLLVASACLAQTNATTPAYESNPEFVKALKQAQAAEKNSREQAFVGDYWKKANKIAGGQCVNCMDFMIMASFRQHDFKHAMETAHQMDAAAQKPADHALAAIRMGQAAVATGTYGSKPNVPMLEDAEVSLAKVKSVTPSALYVDGQVLAMLKKDDEAAADFAQYAKLARKDDPMLVRAQHFAANPALAREKMAPTVVVNTLAGKQFNLDNMNGKVVLIDFWATWCGPCNEELPHMKELAAKYANEPFELISVSWDADEGKWKDFIVKNNMTWNQYRDTDHSVTEAFGINAIPHYFTIDSNGVLTAENLGSGSNIDGRIKKLVAQAKEAQREAPRATASNATPGQ